MYISVAVRTRKSSHFTGVEVTEVDHGVEYGRDAAKLDDLLKSAELVYLSHGFKSETDARAAELVCGSS